MQRLKSNESSTSATYPSTGTRVVDLDDIAGQPSVLVSEDDSQYMEVTADNREGTLISLISCILLDRLDSIFETVQFLFF
jgi:hypothetical protein